MESLDVVYSPTFNDLKIHVARTKVACHTNNVGSVRAVIGLAAILSGIGCGSEIGDIAGEANLEPDPNTIDEDPKSPVEEDPEPVLLPCTEGDVRLQAADGQCYALVQNKVTWQGARDACVALGSALARIDSAAEQAFVDPLIGQGANGGSDEIWMGANDLVTEGTFLWVDGAALTYTDWRAGQPSGGATEDCVVWDLDDSNRWDDRPCGSPTGYICERPASLP